METILANLGGKVRRVTLGGREWFVAPASMIVPGVLNGSKGALYYPPDEVARDVAAWNHTPITVYHPTNPLTGENVSAREPGVLDRQGIGWVKGTTFNGKLRAEAWIDVERARQVDQRVHDALAKNQQIELSTGLFTDNEERGGVDPKGRPFTHIARNHKPDHLAILPDQVGACSINDGCGVMVNQLVDNANPEGHNQYTSKGATSLSKKAHELSKSAHEFTGERSKGGVEQSGYALKVAGHARTASDKKEMAGAKISHEQAAKEHTDAAAKEHEMGYHEAGKLHEQAAKAHSDALTYRHGLSNNQESTVTNEQIIQNMADRLGIQITVNAPQPRGTVDGQFRNHPPRPQPGSVHQAATEGNSDRAGGSADVGTPFPAGEDGRGLTTTKKTGQGGTAGKGDEDDHDPGDVTSPNIKADKKTGLSTPVVVGNKVDWVQPTSNKDKKCPDCGKPMDECSCEPTDNDFSMSDYGGQYSQAPHDASKMAAMSSMDSEHGPARDKAMEAVDASKVQDSEGAAKSHLDAAKMHEGQATSARKDDSPGMAAVHDKAASMHRKAASMHSATMNQRSEPVVVVNDSPPGHLEGADRSQVQAAMAAMGSGAASSHAAQHSSHANKKGTAKAHSNAATAHREAAKKSNDIKTQESHMKQARSHDKQAKALSNNMLVPEAVINACTCQATKQHLIAMNAKAEGSNADVTGADSEGDENVGGYKDGGDSGYKDEDELETPTVKGKSKAPSMNAWLAAAPPEVRSIVGNALKQEQAAKLSMVRQMVSNVQDEGERHRIGNDLMKEPMQKIQDLFKLRGHVSNQDQQQAPALYMGAGTVPTGNVQQNNEPDILLLPVMNYAGTGTD